MILAIVSIWLILWIGGCLAWYHKWGNIKGDAILMFFIFAPIWGPLAMTSLIEIKKKY